MLDIEEEKEKIGLIVNELAKEYFDKISIEMDRLEEIGFPAMESINALASLIALPMLLAYRSEFKQNLEAESTFKVLVCKKFDAFLEQSKEDQVRH